MSEPRDPMLFEICRLCNGTGHLAVTVGASTIVPRECVCKPLRVVPIGLTAGQLERLFEASPEGRRIREVSNLPTKAR